MTENLKFVFGRKENMMEKEEKVGFQHFPYFLQKFFFSEGCYKFGLCGKGLREKEQTPPPSPPHNENGRKFSKWVENIVGKREIACYEQFLLFPQSFQKTRTRDTY